MLGTPNKIEFELLPNNPSVRGHMRVWAIAPFPGLPLIFMAYAVGWLSGERALWVGLTLVVLSASFWWWFRDMGRGTVELSADSLIVRSRSGRQVYTWADIAEIRLNTLRQTSVGERIWAAVTRVDVDLPLVELRLKRGVRLNPLSGNMGSVKFGIPGFMKSIRIYVRDPEGLVRVANSYLRLAPPR